MNTGEKGVEPLTFGFGNHYSTIKTILLILKIVNNLFRESFVFKF